MTGVQTCALPILIQFSNVNGVTNANISQSTTAFNTGIVIPAQSIITDIYVYVTTAFVGGTLSVGTSSASTELATGITCTQGQITVVPTSTIAAWLNPASSQDVAIYAKSSANGAGTFVLAVAYAQAVNGFTNGQYT